MNALDAALRLLASPTLYWHGTSTNNYRSILSKGLSQEEGSEAVWGEDQTPGREDYANEADYRSELWDHIVNKERKRTYGGVYLSTDWFTAYSSAGNAMRKFGGERLLVATRLEPRTGSILLDEDVLPDPQYAVAAVFQVAANDYWYASWAAGGYNGIGRVADMYLKTFGQNHPPADPRRLSSARDKVAALIRAWVERELSLSVATERSWNSVTRELPEAAQWDWRQKEEAYRSAVADFSRTTNWAANVQKPYMHNVRALEPIGFSGSNRIVMLVNCHEKQDPTYGELGWTSDKAPWIKNRKKKQPAYYETFEVLWGADGEATQSLIAGARKGIGERIIVYGAGQVFFDGLNPPVEQAEEPADGAAALEAALARPWF